MCEGLHVRRSYVVDPRMQDVGPRKRAPGERILSRVDDDVVAPCRRILDSRRAHIEDEVRHQLVRVRRHACVAEHVVLVERAQQPRVDDAGRAEQRVGGRVDLRPRARDRRAGVDGAGRNVHRVHLL